MAASHFLFLCRTIRHHHESSICLSDCAIDCFYSCTLLNQKIAFGFPYLSIVLSMLALESSCPGKVQLLVSSYLRSVTVPWVRCGADVRTCITVGCAEGYVNDSCLCESVCLSPSAAPRFNISRAEQRGALEFMQRLEPTWHGKPSSSLLELLTLRDRQKDRQKERKTKPMLIITIFDTFSLILFFYAF